MSWTVTIDGETITTDDLRLAELVDIESRTGATWNDLKPYTSAFHAFSILCVLYEVRRGLTIGESAQLVGAFTAGEAVDHFGVETPATPLSAA